MSTTQSKQRRRSARHARVRAKVSGTAERPRIALFRSNRFIYAQVIDDIAGKTLASSSDARSAKGKAKTKKEGSKTDSAKAAGAVLAGMLKEKGISSAVLDRGGFKYHGRVKAFADGVREGGINI